MPSVLVHWVYCQGFSSPIYYPKWWMKSGCRGNARAGWPAVQGGGAIAMLSEGPKCWVAYVKCEAMPTENRNECGKECCGQIQKRLSPRWPIAGHVGVRTPQPQTSPEAEPWLGVLGRGFLSSVLTNPRTRWLGVWRRWRRVVV